MLKQYTAFIDTNIYLNAAEKLGYEFSVINFEKSFAKITHKNQALHIYENWLSLNDQVAYAFAKDKYVSGEALSSVIPKLFPKTIQVFSKDKMAIDKMIKFAKTLSFSMVIKPNNASLGKDVYISPQNEREIQNISAKLLKKYDSILGQQLLNTQNEYRIVYLNGKFFDAVRRIPAYITGSGSETIRELITKKNQARSQYNFPPIVIDTTMENLIGKKELNLKSILKKDQKLKLKSVCSFAQGGETERVDKKCFHPVYLDAFKKIAQISRLRFVGIDLMANHISDSPSANDGVNEINSAPMADLHYAADLSENKPLDSAQKLLRLVLD